MSTNAGRGCCLKANSQLDSLVMEVAFGEAKRQETLLRQCDELLKVIPDVTHLEERLLSTVGIPIPRVVRLLDRWNPQAETVPD